MKRIMVVDDDKINNKMLTMRLRKLGYEVVQAHSGYECIQILADNKFDLLLLDIIMPDMTGIEILEELRKEVSAFELPIIMQSGVEETAEVVKCFKLGANDFLTKPINIDLAHARIKTHLMLGDLSSSNSKKAELEIVQSMIVTYNHELNNPLTIALGMVSKLKKETNSPYADKAIDAMMRIADIVSKIDSISSKEELQKQQYGSTDDMIDIF